MLDQVVPNMGAVGLDHAGKIVFVERAVHDMSFQSDAVCRLWDRSHDSK
jgi:hypothetical protein